MGLVPPAGVLMWGPLGTGMTMLPEACASEVGATFAYISGQEMLGRHQELADLVRQDAVDRDVVDQRITEKMESIREMADFAADRLIAFHQSLTPEQREKIAAHIENRSSGGCRFGLR